MTMQILLRFDGWEKIYNLPENVVNSGVVKIAFSTEVLFSMLGSHLNLPKDYGMINVLFIATSETSKYGPIFELYNRQ